MKPIVAILVLTILALAGSRRILFARSVPLGARLVFLTGTEFMVVGFLLGPHYLGLLDADGLGVLSPFKAVGLGWIGLLFGIQFDFRLLGTLPKSYFAVSMAQALFTLAAVFAAFAFLLPVCAGCAGTSLLFSAATLGAAAACTGQPGLAMIQKRFRGPKRGMLAMLQYVASLDALPALVVFGVASCLMVPPGPGAAHPFAGAERIALAVGAAVLLGWLLSSLGRTGTSQPELLLALIGICALCGGLAMQLQVSALFVSMMCGVFAANTSNLRKRMTETLARGEKFLYVLLLILAGATLEIPSWWAAALGVAYVGVRIVSKLLGAFLATRPIARRLELPPWVGLGLAAQAGMALAIVIDFGQMAPGNLADAILAIVLIGIVLSELAGPMLAVRVLGREGLVSREETW